MKLYIYLFLTIFSLSSQILERYHPELNWKQFKTKHFDINYHEGTERSAIRLAEIAEEIYGPVTKAFHFEPEKRITWVVKDIDDYSNGGAYFLDHKIEIWTENLDFDLRGTHDWLRNVVTHEFIHIIHIQKSFTALLNIPFALFQWIGYEKERRKDVVRGFPNSIFNKPALFFRVPAWLAEGVAQNQVEHSRYDFRDAHREMVLRDRFLSENVLSLEEMSVFGKSTIGNESSYNQGFSFVRFLTKNYGEVALQNISNENKTWSALVNYNEVFKRALGKPLDSLYLDWRSEKKLYYNAKLKSILSHETTVEFIEEEGEANWFPKYSPDGKFIAYISSKGNNRFSRNALILYHRETKETKKIASLVSSQIEWFPSGKAILYSKQTDATRYGSHYNDLYMYDLDTEKETRLTKNCRARNATINQQNQIVFVSAYDGSTNLMGFTLAEEKSKFLLNQTALNVEPFRRSTSFGEREAWVKGYGLKYLTHHTDFTQYYHPSFKNDTVIVTDFSNGYTRNIKEVHLLSNAQTIVLDGAEDYRNPKYIEGTLYFSSDKTGIYNIYKKENDAIEAVTNVSGGAFMPDVLNDNLVFSLYKNVGYKIAETTLNVVEKSVMAYEPLYQDVPIVKATALNISELNPTRVKYNFNSFYFVPRAFMDGKRLKLGGVLIVNELMNKASLLVGASYQNLGERDIFGLIEIRSIPLFGYDPVFFVEGYNQATTIEDKIQQRFGAKVADYEQFIKADREINFSLWQFEFGFKLKVMDTFDWRFAYINSRYHASLEPTISKPFYNQGNDNYREAYPFLRYDYHKGGSFENRFLFETHDPSFTGEIAPQRGHRQFLRIAYNKYNFLDKFSTNTGFLKEVYKKYNFWNVMFKSSWNFPGVFKSDGLNITVASEGNLSETDEFYDIYVGGWMGLKGYPYFSMHGRQMLYGSLNYHSVIGRDLMWDFGLDYIKNIAIGGFYELGDTWNKRRLNLIHDVGLSFRADTYGPLKLAIEFAYPLDILKGKQRNSEGRFDEVIYPKEWRYYFSFSYDFGLKEVL